MLGTGGAGSLSGIVGRRQLMSTFDYIFVGFLLGVATTAAVGACFHRRSVSRVRVKNIVQDNIEALWTLKALRSGDMDKAINYVEDSLNVAVIMLGSEMHQSAELRRNPDLLFDIRRAKEYRDRYPHKSKVEGEDWNVARTFALVDEPA